MQAIRRDKDQCLSHSQDCFWEGTTIGFVRKKHPNGHRAVQLCPWIEPWKEEVVAGWSGGGDS